jgi:hypothetical protein
MPDNECITECIRKDAEGGAVESIGQKQEMLVGESEGKRLHAELRFIHVGIELGFKEEVVDWIKPHQDMIQ